MKRLLVILAAILLIVSAAFGYIRLWSRYHVPYLEVRDSLEAEAKRREWKMISREPTRQSMTGWYKWIEYARTGRTEEEVTISEWDAVTGPVMAVAFRDGLKLKYIKIMPRYRGDSYGYEIKTYLQNKFPDIDCRNCGEK